MSKYIILIVVFFIGCQNVKKEPEKTSIIFSEFPHEENVSFNDFMKFEHGIISKMFLRDTTLIVYDWRAINGYFFYEYGLSSKLNIKRYVQLGSRKGQALGSLSMGIYKKHLWMYDISLDKIIFSDLETQPSSTNAVIYKELPFSQKYYNIQFIDSSKVIANGNYQTPNKIQEVDLHSGKILADFGVIDSVPKNIPFYAWKRAQEALLTLRPTNDKLVLAHLRSDQIEIFDLKNNKSITVKGPENFNPEFVTFKSNDDQDLIGRNEKSRNAFGGLMATNKYIYVSFSGNNVSSQYINYCKTLYIYDWDGKPVKKINLDRYVGGFTVSNDDKTLYAYDVISKFIVRTKI